jgi:hypothetical protein
MGSFRSEHKLPVMIKCRLVSTKGDMVQVKDLGVEQGVLSGEVTPGLSLPETNDHPAKLALQLLEVGRDRLIGTVRVDSTCDLPLFGLLVYISLTKEP